MAPYLGTAAIERGSIVDDAFVRALFGTDIKGLAERIKRGEYKLPKKELLRKKVWQVRGERMMGQLVAFKCWLQNFVLLVSLLGLMVLGWSVMVELVKDTLELFKRWFRR